MALPRRDGTGGQPISADKDLWRIFVLFDLEVSVKPGFGVILLLLCYVIGATKEF